MSGDGLDGVQCVQGQMKGSVLKCCDQDHCGVQGVQCHVLNKVIQMSELDYMWRSMIKHDDEVQGDQIELHESIRGVHGAMTSDIQDVQKGGMMQMYMVITVR